MKKKYVEVLIDIDDSIVESVALSQQMKEEEAKKKAAEAAFNAYTETLKRELGYESNNSCEQKKYTRMSATKFSVPAKYSYEFGRYTSTTCRIFVKSEDRKMFTDLNPNLFMRGLNRMDIVWPDICDGYSIEIENGPEYYYLKVQAIGDGNVLPIVNDRLTSSFDLVNRVDNLINRIKARGYVEL